MHVYVYLYQGCFIDKENLNMEDLISIIIPIYNVADFLEDSLESVVNQTYNNLQIILVNDASEDGSDIICKNYEKKDIRICLINHEIRKGVAEARNTGLNASKGKYIGFVDPDDFVELNIFEKLYYAIKKNSADISVCGYRIFGNKKDDKVGRITTNTFNRQEALGMLVKDSEMPSYLWNKLFKVELFENCLFNSGCRYEDLRIMHRLFMKANTIATIDNRLYHYRIRNGSITNTTKLNNSKELIDALDQRCEDLLGTNYYIDSRVTELIQIRRILSEIILSHADRKLLYNETMLKEREIYNECCKSLNISQKLKCKFFFGFPTLYAKYLFH